MDHCFFGSSDSRDLLDSQERKSISQCHYDFHTECLCRTGTGYRDLVLQILVVVAEKMTTPLNSPDMDHPRSLTNTDSLPSDLLPDTMCFDHKSLYMAIHSVHFFDSIQRRSSLRHDGMADGYYLHHHLGDQ